MGIINPAFLQAGAGAVARTVQSKDRDIVSVKDFGAVGDGITDDTIAIQKAITNAEITSNKDVYFPAGQYYCGSGLTINGQGISLRGASSAYISINTGAAATMGSSIQFGQTLGVNGIGITVSNTSYGCSIRNMSILGTTYSRESSSPQFGPLGTIGIDCHTDFSFFNVLVQAWSMYGIRYTGPTVYPILQNVHVTSCGAYATVACAAIGLVGATPAVTGMVFDNVQMVSNEGNGLYAECGYNVLFKSCWLENNWKEGLKVLKADMPASVTSNRQNRARCDQFVFQNCWFENNGFNQTATYLYSISISSATPGTTVPPTGFRFKNCLIDNSANPPNYKTLEIIAADDITFEACNFSSNFGSAGTGLTGASFNIAANNVTKLQYLSCRGSYFNDAAVTISNASPCVVTWPNHGAIGTNPGGSTQSYGSQIQFSTTGVLPSPLVANTVYWINAAGLTANTFQIRATEGGAAINTTTAGSGIHTADYIQDVSYGVGIGDIGGSSNSFGSRMSMEEQNIVQNWTPVITTTGGSFTYNQATGYATWVRTGNLIRLHLAIVVNNIAGAPTGSITVTNLPYNIYPGYYSCSAWAASLTVALATGNIQALANSAGNNIVITRYVSGADTAALGQALAVGSIIVIDLTYPCTG